MNLLASYVKHGHTLKVWVFITLRVTTPGAQSRKASKTHLK